MTVATFLSLLGDEIQVDQLYEESFILFSSKRPSHGLGFISKLTSTLEITVAGQDLTVHQSPAILESLREAGTTGAVLWQVTPAFANWIGTAENPLFTHNILDSHSHVLELGCGVSGVLALTLGTRVRRYLMSDQEYVLKLAQKNIDENLNLLPAVGRGKAAAKTTGRVKRGSKKVAGGGAGGGGSSGGGGSKNGGVEISAIPLDWETDHVRDHPAFQNGVPLTAIVACDCIYNEALVEPFVETCVEACSLATKNKEEEEEEEEEEIKEKGGENNSGHAREKLRQKKKKNNSDRQQKEYAINERQQRQQTPAPTIVIIAQELRSPEVFEFWLETFHKSFHTYRVPDHLLSSEMNSTSGFSVHVGVLRS